MYSICMHISYIFSHVRTKPECGLMKYSVRMFCVIVFVSASGLADESLVNYLHVFPPSQFDFPFARIIKLAAVWQMCPYVLLEIDMLLSHQETLLMDREAARKASRGSTGLSVWVRVLAPSSCARLILALAIISRGPKHISGTCKQTLCSSFLHPEVSQMHQSLKTV